MPDFPLFPDAASTAAGQVDLLYLVWVVVSLFFSLLIALTILVFFMKYKRRSETERGSEDHVPTLPIEITWSAIPLVIALGMFAWGAKVFFFVSRPPADAVEYFVTGKQWMWKVQHPEGVREINTLHLPVGRPVKLTMTSEDVIHSFYVPAFRVKQDVLPGRYSSVWFEPTRPGVYHLFCAEYCGGEHSLMGGSIVVLETEAYEAWLAGAGGGTSLLASGAELYERLACATCHRDPGAPATRGPALAGLYGRTVELVGGGRAIADADYIRESIVDPQARVTAGWQPIMPTYRGQVTEEQLNALVAYVRSLGAGGTAAPSGAAAAAADTAHRGSAR